MVERFNNAPRRPSWNDARKLKFRATAIDKNCETPLLVPIVVGEQTGSLQEGQTGPVTFETYSA